jgi:hypothetical protein
MAFWLLNDLTLSQVRDLIRAVLEFRQYVVRMGAAFSGGAHQAARGPA